MGRRDKSARIWRGDPRVTARPSPTDRGSDQAPKRPVIYAGGGVIAANASDQLRLLVEKTKIPIAMTVMGLGAFPCDDPLSLDMIGMHGSVYSNYAADNADLMLALGVRFDDRVTGKLSEFAKHAKIVHVDIDASELNKNKVAHIPICCDVLDFLTQLNQIVEPPADLAAWHERCQTWKRDFPFKYDEQFEGILPQHAIRALSQACAEFDPIVTTGVGQHQMWAAQYFQFRNPRTWHSSSGLGMMGFGLPAAMGAQVAFPDRLVIDIDGDGSFQMNIQELASCYCEKLPVKVFLLNNQHLGMVVQWEDRFMQGRALIPTWARSITRKPRAGAAIDRSSIGIPILSRSPRVTDAGQPASTKKVKCRMRSAK